MANRNIQTRNAAPQNSSGGRHFQGSHGSGNNNKGGKKSIVPIVAIVLGVILLIVAGILFGKDFLDRKNGDDANTLAQNAVVVPTQQETPVAEAPKDPNASIPVVDWEKLREINPDIIGWLQIPGTVINYPVVQGATNDDYIKTTIKGESSPAGSIFLDSDSSRNIDDQHSIFYGHNMKNKSMFHYIASFIDKKFFDEHRTIYYVTPDRAYVLKTLGTYVTDGSDASVRVFSWPDSNNQTFAQYIQKRMENSVVKADDIKVDEINHLFEFATCSYSRNDGRTILMAVEDTSANNVVPTSGTPVNESEGQMVPAQ